jgi:hypothetical protein
MVSKYLVDKILPLVAQFDQHWWRSVTGTGGAD